MYRLYTNEEKKFMEHYTYGHSYEEIRIAFTERFRWGISKKQIRSYIHNYHLSTGRTGRFEKGQVPPNKGKKGVCAPGCGKTWFQKGNKPQNHRAVGSERIDKNGYTEIKINEPDKWKFKHWVVWEKINGQVPKGHVIIFLDGNRLNIDISNLKLITRRELLTMNRNGFFTDNAEMTDVTSNLAKLMVSNCKARNSKKEDTK